MNELADAFERVSPVPVRTKITEYPDSYPADEPMRRCPDIRKAELQLGFEPKIGLDAGVNRFLSWAIPRYQLELG